MTARHRRLAGALAATAALVPVAVAMGAPPAKGPPHNTNACPEGVKIEPVVSGSHTGMLNGGEVTITLDVDAAARTFDFTSSAPVTSMRVKGGPDQDPPHFDFSGGATRGTDLHAPVNPRSQGYYGLSHVCVFADPDDLAPAPEEPPVGGDEGTAPDDPGETYQEPPPVDVFSF